MKKTRYGDFGGADRLRRCGRIQGNAPRALENGLTPIAVKEIVYQATDYLGYGRILPFLRVTNETFAERGMELPLDGAGDDHP